MSNQRYEDYWSSSESFHRNVGQIIVDYTGIETCVFDTVLHMMQPRGAPPFGQEGALRVYLNDGWQAVVTLINKLPAERRYGTFINSRIAMARRARNLLAHASLVHIDELDGTRPMVNLRTSGLSREATAGKRSDLISVPLSEVSEAAGFVSTLRDLCDAIYDHLYDCGYSIDNSFSLDMIEDPNFFVANFLQNNEWLNSRIVLPLLERAESHEPQSTHFLPRDFLIEMLDKTGL